MGAACSKADDQAIATPAGGLMKYSKSYSPFLTSINR
jgi:hypothetical protein